MDNDKIMVSVCCLAYNHGKYIRKTLEGFVNQITDFNYEILIHDDCSTDDTVEIIKEYERKYPGIIKPIYQKENQYNKGIKISYVFQFPKAKGKYIAMCEGDDYWCDNHKLQRQFDAMELNYNCTICVHDTSCINENGTLNERNFPPIKLNQEIITDKTFLEYQMIKNTWLFQTSSYFFRRDSLGEMFEDMPKFIRLFPYGDLPLQLFLITKGDIYYIPKIMSCYRLNSDGSYTEKYNKQNIEERVKFNIRLINALQSYNEFTNKKYDIFIDSRILELEFLNLIYCKQFRSLKKIKYKKRFKKLSFKEKIYFNILFLFPNHEKTLKRIIKIYRRILK